MLSCAPALVKPEPVFLSHRIRVPVPVSLCISWLSRSSSYTRRLHSQAGNDLTSSTPSLLHRSVLLLTARLVYVCSPCLCVIVYAESQPVTSTVNAKVRVCAWVAVKRCFYISSSSYGKRLDDPAVTSAGTGTSSVGHLNSFLTQRYFVFLHLYSSYFIPNLFLPLTCLKDVMVTLTFSPQDFLRRRRKRKISRPSPPPTLKVRPLANRRPSRGASKSRLSDVKGQTCVNGMTLLLI